MAAAVAAVCTKAKILVFGSLLLLPPLCVLLNFCSNYLNEEERAAYFTLQQTCLKWLLKKKTKDQLSLNAVKSNAE